MTLFPLRFLEGLKDLALLHPEELYSVTPIHRKYAPCSLPGLQLLFIGNCHAVRLL